MNKMTMPRICILISVLQALLSGCVGSSSKEVILPQTGATMKQIYDRHFQGQRSGHEAFSAMGNVRRFGDGLSDLRGYTRESYNETRLVFSRLPNPDLVMYVFPHLTGPEGSPVPGYTTAFPFYERVHYALPGEVEAE